MGRLLWSLIVVCLPVSASAQELESLLGSKLQEVSHDVVATVTKNARVTYKVTRTFRNDGADDDEMFVEVDLPPHAVASDLKIREGSRWHRGTVMLEERAHRRYMGTASKRPMPLSARHRALLTSTGLALGLRVAPVIAGRRVTISYILQAPLAYVHGRHVVEYPGLREGSKGLVAPSMRVVAPKGARALTETGERANRAHRVVNHAVEDCGEQGCIQHTLDVNASGTSLHVTAEVTHPNPVELVVDVTSPAGRTYPLRPVSKGVGTWSVKVPVHKDERVQGEWSLSVTDRLANNTGVLTSWKMRQGKRALGASGALRAPIPDAGRARYSGASWTVQLASSSSRAALSVVQVSGTAAFAHVELELARALAPRPARAQVVFVLDTSHSNPELPLQLEVLRSYLTHVPDASVQVVTFARRAKALWSGFLPAQEAARRLETHKFAMGNGSAVEQGLRVASDALGARSGPRRVVVLTDASFRPSLTLQHAKSLMRAAGVVVHVVQVQEKSGDVTYTRDAEDTWVARLARAFGGISARYDISDVSEDKALVEMQLRRWSEHLVRPIFAEATKLHGWEGAEVPTRMLEGSSWTALEGLRRVPRKVELRGLLWHAPFRLAAKATRAGAAQTAAFAFSHEQTDQLTHKQQQALALRARVVTEHTSWFAGSVGRVDEHGSRGLGGGAVSRCGCSGGLTGSGSRRRVGSPPKLKDMIHQTASACVAKHGALSGPTTLTLERDRHEVLDVTLDAAIKTLTQRCIVEGVWGYSLPAGGFRTRRDTLQVKLHGGSSTSGLP